MNWRGDKNTAMAAVHDNIQELFKIFAYLIDFLWNECLPWKNSLDMDLYATNSLHASSRCRLPGLRGIDPSERASQVPLWPTFIVREVPFLALFEKLPRPPLPSAPPPKIQRNGAIWHEWYPISHTASVTTRPRPCLIDIHSRNLRSKSQPSTWGNTDATECVWLVFSFLGFFRFHLPFPFPFLSVFPIESWGREPKNRFLHSLNMW